MDKIAIKMKYLRVKIIYIIIDNKSKERHESGDNCYPMHMFLLSTHEKIILNFTANRTRQSVKRAPSVFHILGAEDLTLTVV